MHSLPLAVSQIGRVGLHDLRNRKRPETSSNINPACMNPSILYTSTTLQTLPPNPRFAIPIVAGIGNALLAVPMVRQIKERFPGGHIAILAHAMRWRSRFDA